MADSCGKEGIPSLSIKTRGAIRSLKRQLQAAAAGRRRETETPSTRILLVFHASEVVNERRPVEGLREPCGRRLPPPSQDGDEDEAARRHDSCPSQ